jgi:hypothetical protein
MWVSRCCLNQTSDKRNSHMKCVSYTCRNSPAILIADQHTYSHALCTYPRSIQCAQPLSPTIVLRAYQWWLWIWIWAWYVFTRCVPAWVTWASALQALYAYSLTNLRMDMFYESIHSFRLITPHHVAHTLVSWMNSTGMHAMRLTMCVAHSYRWLTCGDILS